MSRGPAPTRPPGAWRGELAGDPPAARRLGSVLLIGMAGLLACASPGERASGAWGPPALETRRIATDERLISVHAPSLDVAWVAGTGGTWARTTNGGVAWVTGVVPGADSLQFRDVHAVDAETAYLLSIGAGDASRIYRTDDGGGTWELQWTNPDPRAFYDCFAFWDAGHGIAFSDGVDGVFPLIETRDGRTWTPLPDPPAAREGEGSFAASGTCVAARGDSLAWFGTGAGPSARVFRTADRGRTWTFVEAPIAGGTATTGIASVAFLDDLRGAAFGGDVGDPAAATESVAVTTDGGRSWALAGRPERPGAVYGAAVMPGAPTPTLVVVGPTGVAWSADFGSTWTTVDTLEHWGVAFSAGGNGWAVGPGGRITALRFPHP